jgi:hypothetical protein
MNQITEPGARSRATAVLQEAQDKLEEILHGQAGGQPPAQQAQPERES